MPVIIAILLIVIACLIGRQSRRVTVEVKMPEIKPEDPYYGPTPTPAQEEKNKQEIFKHLERFPHGILAERNPEYLEEYLKRIDLDLPPGITTEENQK